MPSKSDPKSASVFENYHDRVGQLAERVFLGESPPTVMVHIDMWRELWDEVSRLRHQVAELSSLAKNRANSS